MTVDNGAMQATGVSGNWTGVCVRAWFGAAAGAATVTGTFTLGWVIWACVAVAASVFIIFWFK